MLTITDIILTPLKPDLKNLKEIDVNASLYYIHRNLPSDVDFLASPEPKSKVPQEPKIARKPIPKASPYHDLQKEKDDQAALQELNEARASFLKVNKPPGLQQTQFAPVAPSVDGGKSMESLSLNLTPAPRKHVGFADEEPRMSSENEHLAVRRPLGPRPLSTGGSAYSTEPRRDASPSGRELQQTTSLRPAKANDEAHMRAASSLLTPGQIPGSMGPPPSTSRPTSSGASSDAPFRPDTPPEHTYSLTLIRRDPQSGAQWNVGTISGISTASQNTASQLNFQRGSLETCINIHLTTQGYHQFTSTPLQGFKRQITTEWTGFWDNLGLGNRNHRGSSSAGTSRGHSRQGSDMSNDSQYATSNPQKKSKMKHYTMLSPWSGKVEFATANGGRSLKGKHTLNSNVAARTPDDEQRVPEGVTVSELRYNLPNVDIKIPEKGLEALQMSKEATSKALKRTSKFFSSLSANRRRSDRGSADSLPPYVPQLPPRPSGVDEVARPPLPTRPSVRSHTHFEDFVASDEEAIEETDLEDEWERLDLSLGREKAGGGNRGKRAKLGKLIIYDEGFKMLDLTVAANMGIWWAGWETDT